MVVWYLLTYAVACFGSIVFIGNIARRLSGQTSELDVRMGAVAFVFAVPIAGALISACLGLFAVTVTRPWLMAGMSALVEETVRLTTLTLMLRRHRTTGVWFGSAYGSAENVLLAIQALCFILAIHTPLSSIPMEKYTSQLFSGGWLIVFLGGIERFFAITLQLSYSILMVSGLVLKRFLLILLVFLAHFLVDWCAAASGANLATGLFATAVIGLISIGLFYYSVTTSSISH